MPFPDQTLQPLLLLALNFRESRSGFRRKCAELLPCHCLPNEVAARVRIFLCRKAFTPMSQCEKVCGFSFFSSVDFRSHLACQSQSFADIFLAETETETVYLLFIQPLFNQVSPIEIKDLFFQGKPGQDGGNTITLKTVNSE